MPRQPAARRACAWTHTARLLPAAFVNYARMRLPPSEPAEESDDEPLRTNVLFKHIQVIVIVIVISHQ